MLYLFKTCYSQGKSIIQVNDKSKPDKPSLVPNLVDICIKNNIKQCFVVDDTLGGFHQIYNTLSSADISLVFGLRMSFVTNPEDKSKDIDNSSHKNIIFAANYSEYEKLIRISTDANVRFFHKEPRIGYDYLHSMWDDDLSIAIPFYDSFLYKNLFTTNVCVPDFRQIKPVVFYEDHNKPHDYILKEACVEFAEKNNLELLETRSVYYESRSDYIAWKARKIMANRSCIKNSTLANPNLSHCSSDTFCIDLDN